MEKLDPDLREKTLAELRDILSEPDPESAHQRRKELADRLRPHAPEVAEWIENNGNGDDEGHTPTNSERGFVSDKVDHIRNRVVLVKYGGNAMVDDAAKQHVISSICTLKELGAKPVVVHGGGPVISELLGKVGVKSRFVAGHRKTDPTVMGYVEMALSGKVNSEIVKLISFNGYRSVGLSGKDGGMVTATKRIHRERQGKKVRRSDLGQVGDVQNVNTDLVHVLLENDYIPVIAPIGVGEDLQDYNVNADMFAGHMAGALGAVAYVVLTDVAGIYIDIDQPESLIPEFTAHAAQEEFGRIIQGGMIPKVESCLIALEQGVDAAYIVNGMEENHMLKVLLTNETSGTRIIPNHE